MAKQLDNIDTNRNRRLIDGAKAFAAADKSDPFTYNRCISHINNGVAGGFDSNGNNLSYDATTGKERRQLPDGTEYDVPAYTNIKRV